MEPSSSPTPPTSPVSVPPARAVWILPAIAASLAITLVAGIALVVRSGDDDTAPPPTTASTTATTIGRDPTAPEGSRPHPFGIGTSGVVAGWRITVQSVDGDGDAVTANLVLLWDGREGTATGDASHLALEIQDARGRNHPLGGPACPADTAGALATVAPLDIGRTATVSVCWTAAGVDRVTSAMVAEDRAVDDAAYFALT